MDLPVPDGSDDPGPRAGLVGDDADLLRGAVDVPWRQAAALLGVDAGGEALPARTACPLCHRDRLHVYEDFTTGVHYHHCGGCGTAGPVVELLAAAWGLRVPEALARLRDGGVPVRTTPPARGPGDPADLWRHAQEFIVGVRSPHAAALRQRLRLHSSLDPDRWRAGPAALLGAMHYTTAEAFFMPGTTRKVNRGDRAGLVNPSRARLFRGGRWSDVLVFPYHGPPGRLCGFAFLGREAGPGDRVYRRVYYKDEEAGLCGLPLAADNGLLGGFCVAVADPAWCVRLHLRHFAMSTRPLPLVAWHDGEPTSTRRAWQAFMSDRVVCWGLEPSPALLVHAVESDGRLTVCGPQEQTVRHRDQYLNVEHAVDIMRRVVRLSVPWRDHLSRLALRGADGDVDAAVRPLLRRGVGLDWLLRQMTGDRAARRLAEAVALTAPVRRVPLGGGLHVAERGGCWVVEDRRGHGQRLLCDAPLRIEEARARDGRTVYRGHVLYRGRRVRFEADADRVDRDTAGFIRDQVVAARLGLPSVDTSVGADLRDLAVRFHPPQVR